MQYDVLGYGHSLVKSKKQGKILDIGIETGLLTKELYKSGFQIYGIDFSNKMLELAKKKMPNGEFYCHDFKFGLPSELNKVRFDYIVSSYAIHHITEDDKIKFIKKLKNILKEEGKIIIADVAFETQEKMEECKENSKDKWDDEEFYIVANKIKFKIKNWD